MPRLGTLIGKAIDSFDLTAKRVLVSIETKATGQSIPPSIRAKIAIAITPMFRQELARAYGHNGLKTVTGELYRAAVQQSEIIVNPRSIVALMPRGKSKEFYAKAGALQYGAVHGKSGARLTKSIKNALKKHGNTTKAYEFFTIDAGGQTRIRARFEELAAQFVRGGA